MITGRELRAARQAAGVSLGKLAEEIGRHKSHLSRVECGNREVNPALARDYERALGVALAETSHPVDIDHLNAGSPTRWDIGQPAESPGGSSMRRRQFIDLGALALAGGATASASEALGGLAQVLTGLVPDERAEQPVDLPRLRDSVAFAKRGYQSCRYNLIARQLPDLLTALRTTRQSAPALQAAEVDVLLAEAYQVTGSVALKFGDKTLASFAADSSIAAARRSGDPVAVIASTRLITHLLSSAGHHARAASLAEETIACLDLPPIRCTPMTASVCGALLLRGAVAAARGEDRWRAASLLDEAAVVAERIGSDGNMRWTAFGSTNVQLHRVHVAVSMADAGLAVDIASRIDPSRIPLPERRARLLLDVARAYVMWGKAELAYRALAPVQRIAPEEMAMRTGAHRLVADLAYISTGPLRNKIDELAEGIGVRL